MSTMKTGEITVSVNVETSGQTREADAAGPKEGVVTVRQRLAAIAAEMKKARGATGNGAGQAVVAPAGTSEPQGAAGSSSTQAGPPKENMYSLSAEQWNPFVGCSHGCSYCEKSFQAQLKRQRHLCQTCYDYTPHEHPARLSDPLKRTGFMEFIFTCASGDVAFCSTSYLERIIARIAEKPDRTFLIQSKDPATFNRVKFPENVILGITLETNRDPLCQAVAPSAPPPSQRFADFLAVKHATKMVTIEPVMDFDLDVMVEWVSSLKPRMVWLGYDSKKCSLPEPPLSKVQELYWELGVRGITVMLKTIPGYARAAAPVRRARTLAQADASTRAWTPEDCAAWAKGAKPHVLAAVRRLTPSGSAMTTQELNAAANCASGGAIVGGINAWAKRQGLPHPLVKRTENGQARYAFASEELRKVFEGVLSDPAAERE